MTAMLLAVGFPPMGSFSASGAAELLATPTRERGLPYHVIARGHGFTPAASPELVWLVQRGALSGEQRAEDDAFPLGFVIAQRGALTVFGASGAVVAELDPGQSTFLPAGQPGALGSASGDLALYDQIALVPAASVPDVLPPGMLVSERFPAPGGDTLNLELMRGILNPDREADLPAAASPALLLAPGGALQLEMPNGETAHVQGGEIALLAQRVTLRNPGPQPATFVIARVTRGAPATAQPALETATNPTAQAGLDSALDAAWHRNGCHRNPGNPACLTVGVASECAIAPTGSACTADSDGDRCADVAEIQAGFDPFDPADCIGGGAGQPAVNCLFLAENLACNGDRIADSQETECAAEREIRLRRNPTNFAGCDETSPPPMDACTLVNRNPACDGFAPG